MNNEQNIDDILKMLKDSVNNSATSGDMPESDKKVSARMSTATLQKRLKEEFSTQEKSETLDGDVYSFDNSFFEELTEFDDVPEEEPILEEEVAEEPFEYVGKSDVVTAVTDEYSNLTTDIEGIDDIHLSDEVEKTETGEPVYDDLVELSTPGETDNQDELEDAIVNTVSVHETEYDEDYDEEEYEEDGIGDIQISELPLEPPVTYQSDDADASPEYDTYPEVKRISMRTLIMDYGRPDPKPPILNDEIVELVNEEEDTPDVDDIISDFAQEPLYEDSSMSDSVRQIMMTLGCDDDLDDLPQESVSEIFSEYDNSVEDGDEYTSPQQSDTIREGYKKATVIALLKLLGCGVLTALLFFYDTLPLFDYDFLWLTNYNVYPAAYVLIGTQLLILSALCLWRSLEDGARRITTFRPNINSMAVLILFFNVVYDLILFAMNTCDMPMFRFLSSSVFFSLSLSEFLMLRREAKCFDIYSSDVSKYTLAQDTSKNSVPEKMYSGGFDRSKNVYSPAAISFPRGFFGAIRQTPEFNGGFMTVSLFAITVISILVAIVMMIFEQSVESALVASMATLYLTLPISTILSSVYSTCISANRLAKRGIALTGNEMIKKYADAGVIVFNDLHLFKKCETKDVGFICYEQGQTNATLAALQIFYSRIGGPMVDVFDNIPEIYKARRIRIRRITRNGAEAVIDKKHVLLVGDADFMKRYGIAFSNSTNKNTSRATVYVSLDGRATAKLSAKYVVEPVFDMLIERLNADGGHCVIETYDPVINTAFVAGLRDERHASVSIVHKNAADINARGRQKSSRISDNGILAISSRLKLVEAVVWCNRINKANKKSAVVSYVATALGLSAVILLCALNAILLLNQYLVMLYLAVVSVITLILTLRCFPRRSYFTVGALEREKSEYVNNPQKKEK